MLTFLYWDADSLPPVIAMRENQLLPENIHTGWSVTGGFPALSRFGIALWQFGPPRGPDH
jgi:hypothetical protein